jgi:hypothetical protein
MTINGFDHLKREVKEIRNRFPTLSPDNAFVAWFLRAFITTEEESAIKALCGGANDKGIDAIYIDDAARTVFILQGKYRQKVMPPNEPRVDIVAMGELDKIFADKDAFEVVKENADSSMHEALSRAFHVLNSSMNYRLGLYFVTTGKVSKAHREEAAQNLYYERSFMQVFDRTDLMRLMQDYVEGASPPIPMLEWPIAGDDLLYEQDEQTGISTWIFSMIGDDLGTLFKQVGVRLFARNIRGFLGKNTAVNRDMRTTLKQEPEYFWYYNNGITVICDDARQITGGGKKVLKVVNAQVINGQQTTRTLAANPNKVARVLVKLLVVPRDTDQTAQQYNHTVGEIVAATNWQNQISQADLRANDRQQVWLERELYKYGYQYLRKRQTKGEARRLTGGRYRFIIKRDELARAIAGCLFEPHLLRLGKDLLFEDESYNVIFDERSASDYLTFHWFHEIVRKSNVGSRKRGYARWSVMNLVWSRYGKEFKKLAIREAFRYVCERKSEYQWELQPFYQALDIVFDAAMAFYRKNKRTEKGTLDESSFFRKANLSKSFAAFWKSQANSRRRAEAERKMKVFFERLNAVEL